jgi:hypothetical protein
MTVQRTGGQFFLEEGDFIRTDRGVTWAIFCRDALDFGQFVGILVRDAAGQWTHDGSREANLDDGFDVTQRLQEYPDVLDWFTKFLIPKLNAWLAMKFPALGASAPPPAPLTRIEQADLLIKTRLQITVNSDGTLTASLK